MCPIEDWHSLLNLVLLLLDFYIIRIYRLSDSHWKRFTLSNILRLPKQLPLQWICISLISKIQLTSSESVSQIYPIAYQLQSNSTMALHITHVHSPSDCDFCNRRTVGQSVPDLTLPLYGSSPPTRSLVPSPMRTPALSPRTAKGPRARLSRQHRLHSRASSCLNAATSLELLSRRQGLNHPQMSPSRKASEDLQETPFRRRVYTMPSSRPMETSDSADLYRLRSFSVTSRGSVLNLGDLMCFRSRSDFSNNTSEGSRSSLDFRDRASSSGSMAHSDVPHFRVLVMGEEGVGKTSLIAQFMTSEYLTVRNALSNECQGEFS